MNISKLVASMGAFALLSAPLAAHAETHTHDGFYLRLAPGLGYVADSVTETVSFNGSSQSVDAKIHGVAGQFEIAAGGAIAPGVILGGTLIETVVSSPTFSAGGVSGTADGSLNVFTVGPFVNYYFDPNAGLHIQGIVGYSALSYTENNGNGTTTTTSNNPKGFSLAAGIGDEWWVSDEWSIGLMGRLQYIHATNTEDGVDIKHSVLVPALLATFTYN